MRSLLIALALAAAAVQSRTGDIAGHISKDGKPVAGVRVILLDAGEPGQPSRGGTSIGGVAQSDSDGRYSVLSVSPGRYYIAAGALETPTYYPGVTSLAEAKAVTIGAGSTTNNLDFKVAAVSLGFTVSGRVVRPPGPPTPNPTTIILNKFSSTGEATQSAIKPDGSFEFTKVRPGPYSFSLTPATFFDNVVIQVVDTDITDVKVGIPPTITVNATASVEGGGLLPPMTLTFAPYRGGRASASAPGIDGIYRTPLLEGEYRVSWSALPSGYWIKSITAGSVNLLTDTLKIAVGDTPDISIKLGVSSPPPWVKVSGRIIGLPAPAANETAASNSSSATAAPSPPRVTLLRDTPGAVRDATPPPAPPPVFIASDGAFELPMVPPGAYRVVVVPAPEATEAILLNVSNKDILGLEVVVPRKKEIIGRVTVERNGPMPPLTFQLADPITLRAFANISARPESDGTFKISLPVRASQVTIAPNSLFPGYSLRSISYGAVDLARNSLTVASADTAELRLTFATPAKNWFKVTGTVTGPGVTSATKILISPQAGNIDASQITTVQPDGSFEFPAAFPGTYAASALPVVPGVSTPGFSVNVVNRDVSGVQITVPIYLTVAARVSVEGGGPIPGFSLTLDDAPGRFTAIRVNPPQADGPFDIRLPEGEHRVGLAPTGLPMGYTVKAFTYGSTDLLHAPLKLSTGSADELQLTLSVSPKTLFSVSGRVLRLDPNGPRPSVRLSGGLLDRFSIVPPVAPVGPDGTFQFLNVLPGGYSLSLQPSTLEAPQGTRSIAVSVTDRDVTNLEIP